jgi:hypothetical protein
MALFFWQKAELIFKQMREDIARRGLNSELFTFVDAAHLTNKGAVAMHSQLRIIVRNVDDMCRPHYH